jgi:gas vesicle protein
MMRNREREVIVVDRGDHSPLWWLMVGAAVGAGLGLLFAPKSGEETRADLGKRIAKLREAADDTLGGLHGVLDENAPVHRSASDEDADEPAELLEDEEDESPARGRRGASVGDVSPARLELEQRLAEARARRRRALAAEEDEEPVA